MGAAVVGLSSVLLKGQVYGDTPVTTRYSVFTGAFAMIIAAIGLASLFVHAIPAIIPMAIDGLGAVLLAAGGIAWAVGLKGFQCRLEDADKMYGNGLLNEGCVSADNGQYCGVFGGQSDPQVMFNNLNANCKKAFADEIIQFILFAVSAILLLLGFLIMRQGGSSRSGRFVA